MLKERRDQRTELEKDLIWKMIWRQSAGWDHKLLKFLQWANGTARIFGFRIKKIFNVKRLKTFSASNCAKSTHFASTRFYNYKLVVKTNFILKRVKHLTFLVFYNPRKIEGKE